LNNSDYDQALQTLIAAKQRLRSEYEDLVAHPIKNVVAAPSPEDPLKWTGTINITLQFFHKSDLFTLITGVIDELYDSPYEGGLFWVEFQFNPVNMTVRLYFM